MPLTRTLVRRSILVVALVGVVLITLGVLRQTNSFGILLFPIGAAILYALYHLAEEELEHLRD